MRYAKRAVIGMACAFALLPAGAAVAGSGPNPNPGEKQSRSTAPSAKGNPNSVRAQAAGVCSDAYQIGDTGYIYRSGQQVASVKQFYSPECKQNWSYVWVWKSYHDTGAHYDLRTSVYSYTKDAFYGSKSWKSTRQQEFWSGATNTASHCTAGVGGLRQLGDPVTPEAASSKRC